MRKSDHTVMCGLFLLILDFDHPKFQRTRRAFPEPAPAASGPSAETLPQQRKTPAKHKHTQMHSEAEGRCPLHSRKASARGFYSFPLPLTENARELLGGNPAAVLPAALPPTAAGDSRPEAKRRHSTPHERPHHRRGHTKAGGCRGTRQRGAATAAAGAQRGSFQNKPR